MAGNVYYDDVELEDGVIHFVANRVSISVSPNAGSASSDHEQEKTENTEKIIEEITADSGGTIAFCHTSFLSSAETAEDSWSYIREQSIYVTASKEEEVKYRAYFETEGQAYELIGVNVTQKEFIGRSVSLCIAESDASEDGGTGTMSGESSNALADELKKKYSGAGVGDYSGDVIEVRRDESATLTLGFNLWEKDLDIDECFAIYQDAELKYPVKAGDYDFDEDTGILTIEPSYYGIAEMDSSEIDLSYLGGNYMNEDEGNGWGNLAQYYLKTTVDLETGEPLSNPVITVIRVKSEISTAPQLVFDQTEDGYARFSWQAVPGAAGYLLFMSNKDEESGFWEYVNVFADVAGTE